MASTPAIPAGVAGRGCPGEQRGHLDGRTPTFIVVLVGLFAWLRYRQLRDGETLGQQLGAVSPLAWSFLGACAGLLAASALAIAVLGGWLEARAVRLDARAGGVARLRLRDPARVLGGALLVALGVVCTGFGLYGAGRVWSGILAVGPVLGALGVLVGGAGQQWVLDAAAVRGEPTWFGRAREGGWSHELQAASTLRLARYRSGGAFGQPLQEGFLVYLDDRLLLQTPHEGRATALFRRFGEAYPGLRVIDDTAVTP